MLFLPTGKNNGFPFSDILGYLKNTHKNPKFGKVRQVPTREFPTKFPDWDLSHSSKFGIFWGILQIPKNIQKWESIIFSCDYIITGKVCWLILRWIAYQAHFINIIASKHSLYHVLIFIHCKHYMSLKITF